METETPLETEIPPCAGGCGRSRNNGFDNYCKMCRARMNRTQEARRQRLGDSRLTLITVIAQRTPWDNRRAVRATVWRYALSWTG